MARDEDRKSAIELRLQGKTYTEIKTELGISKSTLSNWLTSYPLSSEQIRKINLNKTKWIEKYRNTMAEKKRNKEQLVYDKEQTYWLPLSAREFLLAGLFLYWGEGTKSGDGYVCISNSNPKVIKFALKWFIESLGVSKNKIKILIHLYSDMSIETELSYWRSLLNMPSQNFRRPYIKGSTRLGLSYKSFGHGTCNLIICDTNLKRKIIQSINAISDYYSKTDII